MIHGDVWDGSSLKVARSAGSGKLLVVVSREEWPASMYLPAVLMRDEVIELRSALTGWLDATGTPPAGTAPTSERAENPGQKAHRAEIAANHVDAALEIIKKGDTWTQPGGALFSHYSTTSISAVARKLELALAQLRGIS